MHNVGEFSKDISKQLMKYDELNGTTCDKGRAAGAMALTTSVCSFAGYCISKALGAENSVLPVAHICVLKM